MSVVMTTSLGVDGPGSEDPWHDFEVQDKVDAALGGSNPEFMFIGPLFSPVCEGNSGDRLETCGEGTAAAVSSSLGSDQCMPTSMQISTDVKPLHNMDNVAAGKAKLKALALAKAAKAKADAEAKAKAKAKAKADAEAKAKAIASAWSKKKKWKKSKWG